MVKFSKYDEQIQYNEAIQNLMITLHLSDSMNESDMFEGKIYDYAEDKVAHVHDVINKFSSKTGIKIARGNGLVSYIAKFTSGAGKMLMAAIKGDEQKVREIADKMKKADFVDFLLKFDAVTMHLITGPIHIIDAITGWDIMANVTHIAIASKGTIVVKNFKDAIDYLNDKIENFMAPGDEKDEIKKHVEIITKLADPALLEV